MIEGKVFIVDMRESTASGSGSIQSSEEVGKDTEHGQQPRLVDRPGERKRVPAQETRR